jgi:hypothetical protein
MMVLVGKYIFFYQHINPTISASLMAQRYTKTSHRILNSKLGILLASQTQIGDKLETYN